MVAVVIADTGDVHVGEASAAVVVQVHGLAVRADDFGEILVQVVTVAGRGGQLHRFIYRLDRLVPVGGSRFPDRRRRIRTRAGCDRVAVRSWQSFPPREIVDVLFLFSFSAHHCSDCCKNFLISIFQVAHERGASLGPRVVACERISSKYLSKSFS